MTCEGPYTWVDPTGVWEFSPEARALEGKEQFHVSPEDFKGGMYGYGLGIRSWRTDSVLYCSVAPGQESVKYQ